MSVGLEIEADAFVVIATCGVAAFGGRLETQYPVGRSVRIAAGKEPHLRSGVEPLRRVESEVHRGFEGKSRHASAQVAGGRSAELDADPEPRGISIERVREHRMKRLQHRRHERHVFAPQPGHGKT